MSSRLREYNQKRALLEQLKALKEEYNKTDRDVLDIINPPAADMPSTQGKQRKPRVKIWRNPHTGEEVESKSMLNKRIQAWADEHGREEVRRWVVEEYEAG